MKHILPWLLILQFATGHNLLAELLRTPMLLDHYKTHRKETPQLSFAGFLWLHYCNAQHEQSDSRHTGLPLHCAQMTMAESTIPFPPRVFTTVTCDEAASAADILITDEFLRLSAPLSGVFRPPIAIA